jgi:hypothetical protein
MDPTLTPDDTLPEPLRIEIDRRAGEHVPGPRDTMPCPPPSSLAPIAIDLAADCLDDE